MFVGPFFIYRYKLHDIASARSFQSNACILKVSNSNQDKLKQHFYCFKFLLLFQVVEIFFVLKILTFVVVLFFSS